MTMRSVLPITWFTNKTRNDQSTGILLALTGAVLMSFDPIFIKSSGVSGLDAAFLFGLFSAVSMFSLLSYTNHNGVTTVLTATPRPLVISGLLILLSASCLVISLKYTSVTNTFVILCSAPALTAIFSKFLLSEQTSIFTWLIIAVVGLGVTIVVSGSIQSGNLFGDFLAAISVVSLAFNQTFLRKHKNVSRIASMGLGGLFIALTLFWFVSPETYTLQNWLVMGLMGLFSAPLGRVLSQVATRYITATEVGLILMLEATFAPFLAYLFFTEIPELESIVGGVIIFTAITYLIIHNSQSKLAKGN